MDYIHKCINPAPLSLSYFLTHNKFHDAVPTKDTTVGCMNPQVKRGFETHSENNALR
jgi:hypothetical protein